MLFLIDQTKPSRLRYRCDSCFVEGISTFSRAPDGFLLDEDNDPPAWRKHECEAAEVPAPKAKKAKG